MLFNIISNLNLESVSKKRLWTTGTISSYGSNPGYRYTILGNGSIKGSFPPQIISPDSWKHGSLGFNHGAAVNDSGKLYVWGQNNYGQLGLGTRTLSVSSPHFDYLNDSPTVVGPSTTWSKVSVYSSSISRKNYTLAIKTDGSLWAWGNNTYGQFGVGGKKEYENFTYTQSPVQVGKDLWSNVVASKRHTLAIKNDGTLWAWGDNANAQLGLGSLNFGHSMSNNFDYDDELTTTWHQIPGSWTQVECGYGFWGGIKVDGTLWTWGGNYYGQLGHGDTSFRFVPTQVGNDNDWEYLSLGGEYYYVARFLALKKNKTLWAWGDNQVGELGLGDEISRSVPTQVGTQKWKQISAGYDHNLGITEDGSLWAWGQGFEGQLGLLDYGNDGGNTPTPKKVRGSWVLCHAGFYMSHGVKTDGTLWAWGEDFSNLSGAGWPLYNMKSPVLCASAGGNSFVFVNSSYAYESSTSFIREDGSLWQCGEGTTSLLGYSDYRIASDITEVSNSSWSFVDTGADVTYATTKDGDLFMWGNNNYGGTGDGVLSDTFGAKHASSSRQNVASPILIGSNYVYAKQCKFTEGNDYLYSTLALKKDGTLWGFGWNSYGRDGNGDTRILTPTQVVSGSWSFIATNKYSSNFAIKSDGSLWSWGENYYGNLGLSEDKGAIVPTKVGNDSWNMISSWYDNTYGIKNNKTLWTWGSITTDRYVVDLINQGSIPYVYEYSHRRSSPTIISSQSWSSIASGYNHYIGIRSNGTLWAWGNNDRGQLGLNDMIYRSSPVQIGSNNWNKVYAESQSSFAIRSDGTLWAWGLNDNAKLGLGDNSLKISPTQIGTDSWNEISVYTGYVLGIKNDGSLWSWGSNYYTGNYSYYKSGTLGAFEYDPASLTYNNYDLYGGSDRTLRFLCKSPLKIGNSSWTSVASSDDRVFAIKSDSTLWAWGLPGYGVSGRYDIDSFNGGQWSPVQVGSVWKQISSNGYHTLAIQENGTLWAWGDNYVGQLGQGDRNHRSSPVQIGSTISWAYASTGVSHSVFVDKRGAIFACGSNDWGQLGLGDTISRSSPTLVPAYDWEKNWYYVEAFGGHTFATKTDGSLWAWGANYWGSLGLGDTIHRSSPVQIGTSSWSLVSVSANKHNCLAIKADGTLWSWGYNNNGQLGQANTIHRSSPVQIGTSSWTSVSAGYLHSIAIKKDGSLWSWGYNNNGELGLNDLISRSSPVQIGTSSWISVSSGYNSNHAIRSNGSLWAWGLNTKGQLGQNDRIHRSSPVQVGTSSWTFISTGFETVYGKINDASLWSWGLNTDGQLGQNDTIHRSSPVQVGTTTFQGINWSKVYPYVLIKTDGTLWTWGNNFGGSAATLPTQMGTSLWTSVSTIISGHTVAIKSDGTLWVWGRNNVGQLGQNDQIHRSSPVQIGTSSWSFVSAGEARVLAIKSDGSLWSWGNNVDTTNYLNYELGKVSPVQVGTSSWIFVSSSENTTFAIKPDNTLWAWGYNTSGQLGQGDTIHRSSPVQIGSDTNWSYVIAGSSVFAYKQNGTLWVWGGNTGNQLGLNDAIDRLSPVQVSGSWIIAGSEHPFYRIKSNGNIETWYKSPGNTINIFGGDKDHYKPVLLNGSSWNSVYASYTRNFAIQSNGTLWAWGSNYNGVLGLNDLIHRSSPVQIGTSSWSFVSTADEKTLAIRSNGTLWAWGKNSYGGLGVPTIPTAYQDYKFGYILKAKPVTDISIKPRVNSWTLISAKNRNTFGILYDGSLWGWGQNEQGELGISSFANQSIPNKIGNFSWTFVSAGGYETAAIRSDGTLWTWGYNNYGQLGHGNTVSQSSPVQVGSQTNWDKVYGGPNYDSFMLAIKTNGSLWAWGHNNYGSLGQGDLDDKLSPVQIGTDSWTSIGVGYELTPVLGIKADGSLWAWGCNDYGQLGQNKPIFYGYSSPTQIGTSSWTFVTSYTDSLYAIKSNGSLWVAGDNFHGQLGLGNKNSKINLTQLGNFSWSFVSTHSTYSGGGVFAIQSNGTLWTWGKNGNGQLGLGDQIHRSSPVQIGTDSWSSVSAGNWHTAGIKSNGTLWTWGSNQSSEMGLGFSSFTPYTSPIQVGSSSWTFVSVGTRYTSAIKNDGTLWVWGINSYGNLGLSDRSGRQLPVQLGSFSWTSVSSGNGTTLAIRQDGTLWVWGFNQSGQLGQGDTIHRSSPVQIGTNSWISIVDGSNSGGGLVSNKPMYAIRQDGTLWGWGSNNNGQLGQGDLIHRSSPVQIGTSSWTSVSAGSIAKKIDGTLWGWGGNGVFYLANPADPNFSYIVNTSPLQIGTSSWSMVTTWGPSVGAIRSDGTLWGWGGNLGGELGQGDYNARSSPVQIGTSSWTAISMGTYGYSMGIKLDGTLWGWGENGSGQLGQGNLLDATSPIQVESGSTWLRVATGSHTVAVKSNGTLYAWGPNYEGQLGLFAGVNSPIQVGTSSWTSVCSADDHTVAIKTDGTLWVWGNNIVGELGLGDKEPRSSPVQVKAVDWGKIYLGSNFSAAIRSNNTLWAWGSNVSGQLGQGDRIHRSSPVQIGAFPWATISPGSTHSVAIKTDGTLWAWGRNGEGQLGQGTTIPRSSPVQIGTSSWTSVTSGTNYSLAIKPDGTLWSWGSNTWGQLGDGTAGAAGFKFSPVQIGTSSWTSVSAGSGSVAAIRSDGTLWVWGYNTSGQLGQGDTIHRSSPVQIGTSSWTSISVGDNHIMAIKLDNTLWSCGSNSSGQLGQGDTIHRSSPVQIGTFSWSSVRSSNSFTVAIRSDSTLWSWGSNNYGQLAQNDLILRSSPVQIGTSSWSAVAAPNVALGSHVAGFKIDGTLWTWGRNYNGQLGQGNTIHRSSPVQIGIQGLELVTLNSWISVSSSAEHVAAIKTDGTLWTWGFGNNGSLGQGDVISRSMPAQVNVAQWVQITTSFPFSWPDNDMGTYGIKTDGTIWSWGHNQFGQLGLGNFAFQSSPVQIGTASWAMISGSGYGCFGLYNPGGLLYSWGSNFEGQLGLGKDRSEIDDVPEPVQIPGSSNFRLISGGDYYGLAIKSDNSLWSWGSNSSGQLGLGDSNNRSSPVQVGVENGNWSTVSGGQGTSGGITNDGKLYMWGLNISGQLGLGNILNASVPTQVGSDTNWRYLAIRNPWHTAAIKNDGTLWMWGENVYGQLGQGDQIFRSSPVQVGTDTDWSFVAVAGGDVAGSTLAIKNNGTLWAWGNNDEGFDPEKGFIGLGFGSTSPYFIVSPTQIGTSSWIFVSGGGYSTYYAIKPSRTLWAWGSNYYGSLGQGKNARVYQNANTNSPVQIGIEPDTWKSVHCPPDGGLFTIAQDSRGYLWAWGSSNASFYFATGIGSQITSKPSLISSLSSVSTSWTIISPSTFGKGTLFIG